MIRARKDRPTFASLFCGCGGFDLGFTASGFQLVAAFDNDPLAVSVHRANFGGNAVLLDLASGQVPREHFRGLDVLIAGPPCQGFSTAGRRDPKDPRNQLLLVVAKIASEFKPQVVLVENVPAVRCGDHRRYWNTLKFRMRKAGYSVTELLCEGPKLGLAQLRTRIVLVAWRTGRIASLSLNEQPSRMLGEAIDGVTGLPNHIPQFLDNDSLVSRVAKYLKPGQKLSNVRGGPRYVPTWEIPVVFGRTTKAERYVLETIRTERRRNRVRGFGDADPVTLPVMREIIGAGLDLALASLIRKGFVRKVGRRVDLTHTFNGKYHRLRSDMPAPTVDTKFGDPRFVLHPTEPRGFTVREAARIQGIPDSFVLSGPEKSQFRLVGNAVPPPIATHLAVLTRDALL